MSAELTGRPPAVSPDALAAFIREAATRPAPPLGPVWTVDLLHAWHVALLRCDDLMDRLDDLAGRRGWGEDRDTHRRPKPDWEALARCAGELAQAGECLRLMIGQVDALGDPFRGFRKHFSSRDNAVSRHAEVARWTLVDIAAYVIWAGDDRGPRPAVRIVADEFFAEPILVPLPEGYVHVTAVAWNDPKSRVAGLDRDDLWRRMGDDGGPNWMDGCHLRRECEPDTSNDDLVAELADARDRLLATNARPPRPAAATPAVTPAPTDGRPLTPGEADLLQAFCESAVPTGVNVAADRAGVNYGSARKHIRALAELGLVEGGRQQGYQPTAAGRAMFRNIAEHPSTDELG